MLHMVWLTSSTIETANRTVVTGNQLMIKIENLKLIVKNYGR
jgi:hypothetical protein